MTEPVVIYGPSSGSSRAVVSPTPHGRFQLRVTTDFGDANGIFDERGVREIRDALTLLLEPAP